MSVEAYEGIENDEYFMHNEDDDDVVIGKTKTKKLRRLVKRK